MKNGSRVAFLALLAAVAGATIAPLLIPTSDEAEIRIIGSIVQGFGGIESPRVINGVNLIGGIQVQHIAGPDVQLVDVTAQASSSNIVVEAVHVIRPEEVDHGGQLGGGCGDIRRFGYQPHPPEGVMLPAGREVWIVFEVRARGYDPGSLDSVHVRFHPVGRDVIEEVSADLDSRFIPGTRARCIAGTNRWKVLDHGERERSAEGPKGGAFPQSMVRGSWR